MAVTWSWAWGPETAAELVDMGWDWENINASFSFPEATITYTYPGSPTRYAWAQKNNSFFSDFDLPANITFSPEGWFTAPLYAQTSQNNNQGMLFVEGAATTRTIGVVTDGTVMGACKLMINNVSQGTFSITPNDWHYVALKYSMVSAVEWGAEVFVNGVSVVSGSQASPGAETAGFYKCMGGHSPTYFGQLIIHDSLSDAGQTPRYVTRVNPSSDNAEIGTWTPVGAASDFQALESPFDITKHTNNSAASAGDVVSCKASGSLGLISQLGTTPSAIDGMTLHCWASGSGLNGFTGISDTGDINDALVWAIGAQVTPDINDPTYCYATSSVQPSNGQAWAATSSLFVKYEVI